MTNSMVSLPAALLLSALLLIFASCSEEKQAAANEAAPEDSTDEPARAQTGGAEAASFRKVRRKLDPIPSARVKVSNVRREGG